MRRDLAVEWNAAGFRERTVVLRLAQPAIGDQYRMRENAPFLGERLGAVERGAVDEAVK
jgi:hypothetical protein